MKQLLPLAILLICGLIPTRAQYVTIPYVPSTNAVPAVTTNSTIRLTIPVPQSLNMAIAPSFELTGSGTSAVTFRFDESLDNVNWAANTRSISVTASGTNTVTSLTNFTVGASGYLRLSSVENPNGSAVTNITVTVGQKWQ